MLLHIGPLLIHSYPVLIDVGLLVGAVLGTLEARRRGLDATHVLDAALAAAVGGLILARAAYVCAHWKYYTNHVGQALRLWDGGLAWQGALVGGTAGAATMCAVRRRRLLVTLDALTGGVAPVAICAWLACLMVGCGYGTPTFPGQGLMWTLSSDLPNLYGVREPRVAVQLVGAAWSALVFAATLAAQHAALRAGMVFALWLTLHSFGTFGLGFLRGDEMARVGGWRLDQLLDLALGMVGIATMLLSGPVTQRGSGKSCRQLEREPH